jgi:hypothetical protein
LEGQVTKNTSHNYGVIEGHSEGGGIVAKKKRKKFVKKRSSPMKLVS